MIGGLLAGFEEIVGIEQDETYVSIGRQRIAWWTGASPHVSGTSPGKEPAENQGVHNAQLTLF